jgi:hypothetical protein
MGFSKMEEKTLDAIFTTQDLMKQIFEPPQWIIDDLIPEGLTILSGAPKIGKSWLSLQIANAVATQQPLFGRKVSNERCVLVLALEDNPRRLQSRIMTGRFEASEKLALCVQWTSGPEGLSELLKQNPGIDLVIIDTLAIFSPSDTSRGNNIYDSDVRRMRALKEIVQETNTSIIVIHHDKQGEEGDWANKINGSNGIIATVDTLMRLSVNKRGSLQGKLQITGRDVEDIELSLSLDQSLMHWFIDVAQDDNPMSGLEKKVLELVPDHPETTTSRAIADALGKKQPNMSQLLTKLINKGYVESLEYAVYSRIAT